MMRRVVGGAALVFALPLGAQTIKGAVLAKNEPHHHPVFDDAELRVLRVSVGAKDTTLLHEHGPDYFWIALGASEVINVRPGQPDAAIKSNDLSIHYTLGKFAHVARNPGTGAFNNITVELLKPQSNVKNRCEEAVAKGAMDCPKPAVAGSHPAFDTDQLQVELVTVAPNAIAKGRVSGARGSWLIMLDTAYTKDLVHVVEPATQKWVGGTLRTTGTTPWQVHNAAKVPVLFLAVTAK